MSSVPPSPTSPCNMQSIMRSTLFLLLLLLSVCRSAAISINLWDSFHNLTTCHPGDHNPTLTALKSYLTRFGYLPTIDNPANISDAFDDTLASAIRTYQHNFHLNPTGLLDPPTIDLLSAPRCGVPDVITNSSTTPGRRLLFSYFPNAPSWPPSRRPLTYALTATSTVRIPIPTLRAVLSRAFSRWAAATSSLAFAEVQDQADADITVGFYDGDHGDGQPFDGVLGTLGHAFSPTDGRLHLDAAEEWAVDGEAEGMDLESVVVHEIGHLLGLGHSSEAGAILFPTIRTGTRRVELGRDDVEGIQGLYGGKTVAGGETTAAAVADRNAGGERERWWWAVGRILAGVVVGLRL